MPFDQRLKVSEERNREPLILPSWRIERQLTDLEAGTVTETVTIFPSVLSKLSEVGRKKFISGVAPLLFNVMNDEPAAKAESEISRRKRLALPKTIEEALAQIEGPVPEEPWPEGWENLREVIEAHRLLFGRFLENSMTARLGGKDRGIVIAAGGTTYFTCAYICIRILRKLGCKLPIELWYMGREELDHSMEGIIKSLDVRCIDAVDHANRQEPKPRILGPWTLKPYSILHSSFKEVLFLDADQIPAADPTFLFDEPQYQEKGAILWSDLINVHGLDITEGAFRAFGLPKPGNSVLPNHNKPSDYLPVESGQVLVNKARCSSELTLTLKMAEHEDFLYPHPPGTKPWHIYGDKSVFFAAWWMVAGSRRGQVDYLGDQPFAMPPGPDWIGSNRAGAFLQKDFDGRVIFSHRVQPVHKWNIRADNVRCGLPNETAAFDALEELKGQWHGQIWSYDDQSAKDRAVAVRLAGTWEFFECRNKHQQIQFMPDGRIAGGSVNEEYWRVIHVGEDPIIVISSKKKATAMLGHDHKNGCWVNHGKRLVLTQATPEDWQVWEPFDIAVYNSVVRDNEYQLPDDMKGWRVIDIGGHLGSFVRAALDRGAAHVLTFEPEPRNFSTLCRNLSKEIASGKVTPINAALWRSDEGPKLLGITPWDSNSAAATVVLGGDRMVLALPLDGFLDQPIDLVKLDCEGSEFPILLTSKKLANVKQMVGEWHAVDNPAPHVQVPGQEITIQATLKHLQKQGFKTRHVDHIPERLGHFWAER